MIKGKVDQLKEHKKMLKDKNRNNNINKKNNKKEINF